MSLPSTAPFQQSAASSQHLEPARANRKVLIITYYWPPSGGIAVQRTLKFVKYLQEFGWTPVVYTVMNGEYPELDPSLELQVPASVVVLKRPIWEPYQLYKLFTGKKSSSKVNRSNLKSKEKGNFTERLSFWIRGNLFIPDTRRFWISPSVKFLLQYLRQEKVDAIISTGPPHSTHMIAMNVSKGLGIPWLADFRDPWTTMDYYRDLMLMPFADKLHRTLERKVLHQADTLVVVGSLIKKEFEEKGAHRVRVISNGYDESDFNINGSVALDKEFTLAHMGSFFQRRNPLSLWKAIAALKAEDHPVGKHVRIKLVGRVDPGVLKSIQENGLDENMQLMAQMPHEEVIRHMKSAQILLLPIDDFEGSKWVLTGKLYEYLASGRPILCIGPLDGEAATVLAETRAGRIFDFPDVNGIKDYLVAQYEQYVKGTLMVNGEGIEKYSRKELTRQLAVELNNLVK